MSDPLDIFGVWSLIVDDALSPLLTIELWTVVQLVACALAMILLVYAAKTLLYIPVTDGLVDQKFLHKSFEEEWDLKTSDQLAKDAQGVDLAASHSSGFSSSRSFSKKAKKRAKKLKDSLTGSLALPSTPSFITAPATESQVKLYDKCIYTLSVVNLTFTAYLIGAVPTQFYLWHTPKMLFLLGHRFLHFRREHKHYLLFDFCYWANALSLYYIWVDPTNDFLYQIIFITANGPLAWSVMIFSNSLVFHSLPHMTSAFIHVSPMLFTFCLRWNPSARFSTCGQDYLAADQCAHDASSFDLITNSSIYFYIPWAALYFVVVCVVLHDRAHRKGTTTLFDLIIKMPALSWIGKTSKNVFVQKFVYLLVHFAFAVASMTIAALFLWRSQVAHFVFVAVMSATTAWNGSGYYFSVFARRYLEELKKRADLHPEQAHIQAVNAAVVTGPSDLHDDARKVEEDVQLLRRETTMIFSQSGVFTPPLSVSQLPTPKNSNSKKRTAGPASSPLLSIGRRPNQSTKSSGSNLPSPRSKFSSSTTSNSVAAATASSTPSPSKKQTTKKLSTQQ